MKFCSLLVVVSAVLVVSCTKTNEIAEPISVKTGFAVVSSSGGVSLSGELTGFQKIGDHGFDLKDGSSNSYRYSLGRPTHSGSFSYEIDNNLPPGRYTYSAYIQSGNHITFGDTVSFTYLKNKAPVIDGFSPSAGHIGDTVTISGANFSSSYGVNIAIGDKRYYAFAHSRDKIYFVVPDDMPAGNSSMSVIQEGLVYSVPGQFELYKPVITGIVSSTGKIRSIIDIVGDHFSLSETGNIVAFDGLQANVIAASRTKIKVVVPDIMTQAEVTVTVSAQNSSATSPVNFTVLPPTLSEVPLKGFTSDIITIKGAGFHPVGYMNKVYFGEAEGIIQGNSTTSELSVQVPAGPFPNRTVNVRVSILGQAVNWPGTFTIDDPWLMVSNTLPFLYSRSLGSFVINNKGYAIAPAGYPDESYYLWTMNADYSWAKQNMPVNGKWSGMSVSNGTKAYYYTASASDNFWEFDPVTNTWTALPDFIGGRRDKPGMFAIGEDIYVGWGSDFEVYNIIGYSDFYRYRPSTQSWVKISEPPTTSLYTGRTETSSFTIDGIGYIGCGARTTGQIDFWKYDPSNDQWSQLADFGPKSYTTSFMLNGKGYIVGGGFTGMGNDCWEYTPNSNTWREVDPVGGVDGMGDFSFVVDNIPYAGGGDGRVLFVLDPGRMK